MWSDSWIAWDTETTGFGPDARILEIGCVVFEGLKPVHEWSQLLCPPNVDWNSERVKGALAVNHIDPRDLQGKPAFADVMSEILLELSGDVLVAHNAEFDLKMLNQELAFASSQPVTPKLSICTMSIAARLNAVGPHKLANIAERYRVLPEGPAHRATSDARTAGMILAAVYDQLPHDDAAMAEYCRQAVDGWKRRRR
jgi:DNA polymerase-3 subunit epsilon